MGSVVFNTEVNHIVRKWARHVPGDVLVGQGVVRTGVPGFHADVVKLRCILFEQLLIYDRIDFQVLGRNTVAPMLCRVLGFRNFLRLLEQGAFKFSFWLTNPFATFDKNGLTATFSGRIDEASGPRSLDQLLEESWILLNLNRSKAEIDELSANVIGYQSVVDDEVANLAWEWTQLALKTGELESFGFSPRETPIGLPASRADELVKIAGAFSQYAYLLKNGYEIEENSAVHKLMTGSAKQIQGASSVAHIYATISQFEKVPNLKELYKIIDNPLEFAVTCRTSNSNIRFREWMKEKTGSTNQVDIVREYVDAWAGRRGLFDSRPLKFLKVVMVTAMGYFAGPAIGAGAAVVSSLFSAVAKPIVNQSVEQAANLSLGVIDSFVVDDFKAGWSPKSFFKQIRKQLR